MGGGVVGLIRVEREWVRGVRVGYGGMLAGGGGDIVVAPSGRAEGQVGRSGGFVRFVTCVGIPVGEVGVGREFK